MLGYYFHHLKLAEEKRELFCRLTAFAVCELSKEKKRKSLKSNGGLTQHSRKQLHEEILKA